MIGPLMIDDIILRQTEPHRGSEQMFCQQWHACMMFHFSWHNETYESHKTNIHNSHTSIYFLMQFMFWWFQSLECNAWFQFNNFNWKLLLIVWLISTSNKVCQGQSGGGSSCKCEGWKQKHNQLLQHKVLWHPDGDCSYFECSTYNSQYQNMYIEHV